jgi:hypothetical protein
MLYLIAWLMLTGGARVIEHACCWMEGPQVGISGGCRVLCGCIEEPTEVVCMSMLQGQPK